MKIGIISDTHGSISAWQKAYQNFLHETELIIHCGDVLYHGPRNPLPKGYEPKRLAEALNSLSKPLIFVRGNCDSEVDQMVLEYPLDSYSSQIITPELKILVHHGHHSFPETLRRKIAATYDVVISGHTHLPGLKKEEGLLFLNPGSPALPKNQEETPTIAILETENKEILIWNIENGKQVSREII